MNSLKQLLAALTHPSASAHTAMPGPVAELLPPVSGPSPCGDPLEYDPEYAVLQARLEPRADVQYGDFSARPEAPDWAEVERDARRLLLRSKDITLLVWFTRARCRLAGATGLLEGLASLQAVLQAFPEEVHPQLVLDGQQDPAVRANALAALCDPQGLLGDLRDVMVSGHTAFRLTVRDVERAFAVPRPAYAPEPEGVKRQLADLHARGDNALHALLACGNCVLGIEHWSRATLKDEAPDLRPILGLLACLASFARPGSVPEKLEAEDVEMARPRAVDHADEDGLRVVAGDDAGCHPAQGAGALVALGSTRTEVAQDREQIRALLRQVRQWVEHHEPSSPVAVLLKQADRLWGRRFSEVMHMVPADLMRAWDQDD